MNRPKPEHRLFQENLRFSPYFGAVGGLLAVVLGFWTPLQISYLILAAVIACISFFIVWFGVRRHIYLAAVPAILALIAWPIGRDFLLPRGMPSGISSLCDLQAVGVWMFVLGALYLAFREKPKRD